MLLGIYMQVEWDADNFQVRFRFWESWFFNLKSVYIVGVSDVLINDKEVRLLTNFTSDSGYA